MGILRGEPEEPENELCHAVLFSQQGYNRDCVARSEMTQTRLSMLSMN